MSIAKPFTFTANTYAKASEVNADFDIVYAQVNTNISAIATNATDIDNLENNKADINGSSAQRFAVADPTTNADAVNKQTLFKAIGNSIDYISGLKISKYSGSPNDTILVSAGSCYDSTKSTILKLNSSTTKKNLSQGASTTYYVYIIGDDSGTSIDILISSNSTTPALPSGYTKYRRIGRYKTNSSSNIEYIYQQDSSTSDTQATVIKTYVNGASWYRVWSDGFIEQGGINNTPNDGANTVNLLKSFTGTNYSVQLTILTSSGTGLYNASLTGRTKNTITIYVGSAYDCIWYAYGY